MIVLSLSSCTPSVVRNANAYSARTTKPKTPATAQKAKQEKDAIDMLGEFENKLASNPSNNNPPSRTTNSQSVQPQNDANDRRMLTLREQMQTIEQEQVIIKNQVGQLQDDVQDIKIAIDEIRQALINTERIPERRVVPGVSPNETPINTPIAASTTRAANSSVLLPDEAVKRKIPEEAKSTPKPNNKTASTATPQKKSVAKPGDSNQDVKNISEKPTTERLSPIEEARQFYAQMDYSKSIDVLNSILNNTKDATLITEANFLLGENYHSLSNFQQAIKHYSIVLNDRNSTRRDEAQAKIADCLLKTGQTTEARSAYRNLIEKYPKSEFVPTARKMLQQM